MALRNMVAKLGRPSAAALRLPQRVSPPPALARPRSFFSYAQRGQHNKGINLESASKEEVRRQADLVGKEIDETFERLSLKRDKVETYREDIVGSVKLWVVSWAALELVLYVDSCRRPEKY